MKIVLLGAPLSGKGSQAELISKKYNAAHISTGDLFRSIMLSNSKEKDEIKKYMDKSTFVPDNITTNIVKEKISQLNNFVLDGFPRTINQAEELNKFVTLDAVIYIDSSLKDILSRVEGRRVCPKCKTIYQTRTNKEDFCKLCYTALIKRQDDTVEIATNRYNEFIEKTFPLVDYYKKKGLCYVVYGNTIEEVNSQIETVLQKIK